MSVKPYKYLVQAVVDGDKEACKEIIELIGRQRKATAIRLRCERALVRTWRNSYYHETRRLGRHLDAIAEEIEETMSDDNKEDMMRVHAKRRGEILREAFPVSGGSER